MVSPKADTKGAGVQGYSNTGYISAVAYSYNVRGEITKVASTAGGTQHSQSTTYTYDAPTGSIVDPLTGAISGGTGCTFDGDGRFQGCVPPSGVGGSAPGTITYDANDNILATSSTEVNSLQNLYTYGPSDQPRVYSENGETTSKSTFTYTSLHWLGNHLLYANDSNSNLLYEDIGDVAAWGDACSNAAQLCGLAVEDRDLQGNLIGEHTSTFSGYYAMPISDGYASSSVTAGAVYPNVGTTTLGNYGYVSGNLQLNDFRSDATQVGPYAFDGARVLNPETPQFMTQDPSGGSAASPISERPYTWVSNNPYNRADPTGLFTTCPEGYTNEGNGQCDPPWPTGDTTGFAGGSGLPGSSNQLPTIAHVYAWYHPKSKSSAIAVANWLGNP